MSVCALYLCPFFLCFYYGRLSLLMNLTLTLSLSLSLSLHLSLCLSVCLSLSMSLYLSLSLSLSIYIYIYIYPLSLCQPFPLPTHSTAHLIHSCNCLYNPAVCPSVRQAVPSFCPSAQTVLSPIRRHLVSHFIQSVHQSVRRAISLHSSNYISLER